MVSSAPVHPDLDWRPGASALRLRQRARMLAETRAFFTARGVLEVDTAQLVNHAVTDRHLHSAQVHWPAASARRQYLHTSPEYAMKRLLAAGSGDIYQICHVFRGEESGPLHNSEFTLLEWYRAHWSLDSLMGEVEDLLRALLTEPPAPARRLSYEQLFLESLGCNPLSDPDERLAACARTQGFEAALVEKCGRDELLDLLMGARIGPQLGRDGPVFVHHSPASQAALARLDPGDARVALRFELYLHGVELANGFEELADAEEQAARFRADQAARAARGLLVPSIDEFLLAALRAGLPACAGVALGFDRLVMIACGAQRIEEVMAFASERA
jgi:lysyl-tRNA synthetase class 2